MEGKREPIKNVPDDHPRAKSLHDRHKIIDGMKDLVVAEAGFIAHGRGEAFDYLIGEKTTAKAKKQIKKAAKLLVKAKYPVISVNGNSLDALTSEFAYDKKSGARKDLKDGKANDKSYFLEETEAFTIDELVELKNKGAIYSVSRG